MNEIGGHTDSDFEFNHEAVERRLREGRSAADRVKDKVAPRAGYLDTQLFPGKGDPSAYDKNYSFPDSQPSKEKVQKKVH